MPSHPPGEVNPFEAPRAGIGEEAIYLELADDDAETIRREHIGREANIKSVGHLYYLGTFGMVLLAIFATLMATGVMPTPPNQAPGLDPTTQKIVMGATAVFYMVFAGLYGAMAYGLTHLQTWARWTAVVLTSLGLLGTAFYTLVISFLFSPLGGLAFLLVLGGFNGSILWLLVSGKAGMVFSREYKDIIRMTPHVRLRTSIIAWIFLGVILVAVVGIPLYGLISGLRR